MDGGGDEEVGAFFEPLVRDVEGAGLAVGESLFEEVS